MEDWQAIAEEVKDAIVSVTGGSDTYPVTLIIPGAFASDFEDTRTPDTTEALTGIQFAKTVRSSETGAVRAVERRIMVAADGATPSKGQRVAVGVSEADYTDSTPTQAIAEVAPFAPAGVPLYFTLILD